jgi:hypothetical protein
MNQIDGKNRCLKISELDFQMVKNDLYNDTKLAHFLSQNAA